MLEPGSGRILFMFLIELHKRIREEYLCVIIYKSSVEHYPITLSHGHINYEHYSLKVEINTFTGEGTHILYVIAHSWCIERAALFHKLYGM